MEFIRSKQAQQEKVGLGVMSGIIDAADATGSCRLCQVISVWLRSTGAASVVRVIISCRRCSLDDDYSCPLLS